MNHFFLRAGLLATFCAFLPQAWADSARVIVKYRENSSMLWQTDEVALRSIMSARTGENISANRRISGRLQVVQAEGISNAELISKLSAESDVEYALPDQFRTPQAVTPNDQYFSNQWYLKATERSAIDAIDAWTVTTGSASIVVAVLDTGILPDHPDLNANIVFSSGSLYGYDFITNPVIANDGDGRDADPSDPGDWVTLSDISTYSILSGCSKSDSSWHGSKVAGVIGASSNNTIGIAGVAWNVRILPVRVLGKCGGYDSDIMAAMLWASGISVSGVADNLTPAKIINLSLGSSGSCPAYYSDVISQVTGQGTLIVASAGNDGSSVHAPANCSGILGVSAISNTGSKLAYSSFGSEIALSAPGGGACTYAISAPLNTSLTSPGLGTYDYATCVSGTSFSAPLVSGVAALMLAANASLTPAQLTSLLRSSASTFPSISGLSTCTSTTASVECNCTTASCGAGMLNAKAAVLAAQSYASTANSSSSSGGSGNSGGGSGSGSGGGGGAADPVDILLVLITCAALYTGIRHRR
jgi:serine protease